MKKLIIGTMVAICAVYAHAASVVWSSTSVKDISGANVGASSAYTATVAFWADNSGAPGDAISTTGLTDGSAAMSKYTGTTGDAFSANTTYWTQLILSANDGSASITSEIASFTTDSAASYEINFSTGNGFTTSGAKIDYANDWVAAPEPTSGLLLLLGMAGLSLKRKRT